MFTYFKFFSFIVKKKRNSNCDHVHFWQERRSSHDKNAKLKERKEEKKAEQQAPKISHEETKTKWKRVTIREVQDRDHEVGRVNPPPHPHKTLKKVSFPDSIFIWTEFLLTGYGISF